jgi:hypothetical protein
MLTSCVSNAPALKLTDGDNEPILVAEFQAWTTAPRLSELLSSEAEGHPVYRIDPIATLSGDQGYIPLQDLAAAYVADFVDSAPPGKRVYIAGHCSAAALTLHMAGLLGHTREVTAILVGPTWPDETDVQYRLTKALATLGAAGRSYPELDVDPAAAVAQMELLLKDEIVALAAARGVNGAAEAFTELLTWHRAWFSFLLACHNDPSANWATSSVEVMVMSGSTQDCAIPGLRTESYRVCLAPVPGQDDPITRELASSVLAQIKGRAGRAIHEMPVRRVEREDSVGAAMAGGGRSADSARPRTRADRTTHINDLQANSLEADIP